MSYTIEQKIKGKIYLYKVESYWDKSKKQSRQKRTYIGPKHPKNKSTLKDIHAQIVHKSYGNIFLLQKILNKTGLNSIIKEVFPEHFRELIALIFYEITQREALYMFPFWLEDHYLPETKKLDSAAISRFCDELGHKQRQRFQFQEKWINHLKPVNALYFDITSVSSYSSNIDFIEWGYNRDGEKLAQLNIGAVFCNEKSLPVSYTLYPGSIVDVKTLKNCISYLKGFGLKKFMFILDRGFFSTVNILEMASYQNEVSFLQPLPFSLLKVKALIKDHKKELHKMTSNFRINNELLSHVKSKIKFDDKTFQAHIFLNEKAELDQRQVLIKELIDIEENTIRQKKFNSLKQVISFKEENIAKKYWEFFKWDKKSTQLARNDRKLKEKILKFGYFVISTNDSKLDKKTILENYRNKDQVEKVFNLLKNEMDGNRLRAHSQYNTEARLFIKFIALIVLSDIVKTMRVKKLFRKYSVKEMLSELKKIKFTSWNKENIVSEISKKQRQIFQAFELDIEDIHRY